MAGLSTAACSGACAAPPGSYCPSGSASGGGAPCPAGTFCAAGGGVVPLRCAAEPGFACGVGSATAAGAPCPPAYLCPGGAALPCPGECGPVAWYDATALTLADGAPVTSWHDVSSGGPFGGAGSVMDATAAAADAGAAPTFAAAGMDGGGPGVVFDGSGGVLASTNVVSMGAAHTFFAVIVDGGSSDACCGGVVTTDADAYNGITLRGSGGAGGSDRVDLNVEFGGNRVAGAAYALGGGLQRVLSVVYNDTDAAGSASYVDGCASAAVLQAGSAQATTALRLGARAAAASQFFRGVLGEVLVFGAALSDPARGAVEAYLLAKWLPVRGQLACVPPDAGGACPAGTFVDAGGNCDWCGAAAGYHCGEGSAAIGGAPCPPGSSCAGERARAVPCAPGYFGADAGLRACSPCVPGRFAAANGTITCGACPPGSFTHAYGSAACVPCAYGGAGVPGAVACEAPAAVAVRGRGACTVQPTGDVACWGDRWRSPFVLWAADARARGGRSFIVGAAGVCLGDAFVAVLLSTGAVLVVGGDLVSNASAAAAPFAGGEFELLWCGPAHVCARSASSGALLCAAVRAPGEPGPLVLGPSELLPAAADWLSAAIGDAHVCALAANGSVSCAHWGGTGGGAGSPLPPATSDVLLHIAADGALTCGVRARDRGVTCWLAGATRPLPGGSPAPLKSVCVVGDALLVCGLAWESPGAPNDAAFGGSGGEVCYNASSGAAVPGARLAGGGGAFRGLSCSGGGRCGVGPAGVACDSAALTPACSGNVSSVALLPGVCFGVAAVAVDTGRAPGVAPGDVVEVTLSRATGACAHGATVADGGMFYSPPERASSGGACADPDGACMAASQLRGGSSTWDAAVSAVVYAVGDARGPLTRDAFDFGVDATRIGALAFRASESGACAGPLPGALPVLVAGSWGPHAAPRVLSARANDTGVRPGLSARDTLAVAFDQETNRPTLDEGVLTGSLGIVSVAWADTRTLLLTVRDALGQGGAREVQIGVLQLLLLPSRGVRSRDLSSPPSNVSLLVDGTWGNTIASVASPSLASLTTAGGDPLTITLSATVGVAAVSSDVTVVYGNAAWSFIAQGCVLAPGGDALSCFAAEGVGAGLAFAVSAYGGVIARGGGAAASYATPVLSGVSPAVVDTDYAGEVTIAGREFGPVHARAAGDVVFATVRSSASAGAAAPEQFPGVDCAVTVNHTAVGCRLPGVRGAALQIHLKVAGQATASVSLPTLAPVVRRITLRADATCDGGRLCTRGARGAAAVVVLGENFGPAGASTGGVFVTCALDPGGAGAAFAFGDCRVIEAHTAVACDALPPGHGRELWAWVTVLGVRSAPVNASGSLGYAPPRVMYVLGSLPAVGALLSLVGSNMYMGGGLGAAGVVRVLFGGAVLLPVAVRAYGGNASLDEVVFAAPSGAGAGHAVAVVVGSQRSPPVAVAYAPPVIAAAALAAINGAARFGVRVSGANFGARGTLVVVRVNGSGCELVPAFATDGALTCWTDAQVGLVEVSVAGQAAVVPVLFNASAPIATPLVGAALGAPSLPLTGGGVLVISGSNVAPDAPSFACVIRVDDGGAAAPAGAGGEALCALARALRGGPVCSNWCTAISAVRGALHCTTPPAASAAARLSVVAVALLSCRASPPFRVSYDAPLVVSVGPVLIPTAGGTALEVLGLNFERNTSVSIAPAAAADGPPAPCVVREASAVRLVCVPPAGRGARAQVLLTSATWGALWMPVAGFGFRAPIILSVLPLRVDARGGTAVTVSGSDFSSSPTLLLGGKTMDVGLLVSTAHGRVTFYAPPGVGAGVNVTLRAGDQAALAAHALSYSPPRVSGTNVSYVDGWAGGPLQVLGSQFGPPGNLGAPRVTIEDVACERPRVLGDGALLCTAPPRLSVRAAAAIVVTIGEQRGVGSARVACPPGFFGGAEERCRPCPVGATCGGEGIDPVPAAGYSRTGREVFEACVPSEACVGMDPLAVAAAFAVGVDESSAYRNCAVGYRGALCADCAASWYRKPNQQRCIPCPNNAVALIVLFFVFMVLMGSLIMYFHRKMINLKGLTIGIDLFQILSMFHGFKYPWPAAITTLFDIASVSTASIEMTAPQCTISLTYVQKWAASQVLPVFLLGVLVFGIATSVLLRAVQAVVVQWRGHVTGRAMAEGAKAALASAASRLASGFVSGIAELTDVIVGAIFTVRSLAPRVAVCFGLRCGLGSSLCV